MNRLKRILVALGFCTAAVANAGEFTSLSVASLTQMVTLQQNLADLE